LRTTKWDLQALVEFAGGAGDEHSCTNAALTIFHALDDASGLSAFGTVGAFGCIHHLFAVSRFGDLGHALTPILTVISRGADARRGYAVFSGTYRQGQHACRNFHSTSELRDMRCVSSSPRSRGNRRFVSRRDPGDSILLQHSF